MYNKFGQMHRSSDTNASKFGQMHRSSDKLTANLFAMLFNKKSGYKVFRKKTKIPMIMFNELRKNNL